MKSFIMALLFGLAVFSTVSFAQQEAERHNYFEPAFKASGYLLSTSLLSTWTSSNAIADAHGGHMYDTERALDLLALCSQSLQKIDKACVELLSMPELRAEDASFVRDCQELVSEMQSHVHALRSYLQNPSDAAWANYLKRRRIAWELLQDVLQLNS